MGYGSVTAAPTATWSTALDFPRHGSNRCARGCSNSPPLLSFGLKSGQQIAARMGERGCLQPRQRVCFLELNSGKWPVRGDEGAKPRSDRPKEREIDASIREMACTAWFGAARHLYGRRVGGVWRLEQQFQQLHRKRYGNGRRFPGRNPGAGDGTTDRIPDQDAAEGKAETAERHLAGML